MGVRVTGSGRWVRAFDFLYRLKVRDWPLFPNLNGGPPPDYSDPNLLGGGGEGGGLIIRTRHEVRQILGLYICVYIYLCILYMYICRDPRVTGP